MRPWSSACLLPPRASIGSGVSSGSAAGSSTGRHARRNPERRSIAWRICRTCTSSASATAAAWNPAHMAREVTAAFAVRCASSPRSTQSSPLDRVLVTGDVTDAGTRAEWAEFIDLFEDYPDLRARLSFVPGNHDVNIVDRSNPGRSDLPGSSSQSLRKLRVVLALDALQGSRAHVVDRASGALGPSLQDYLREGSRAERLRALAERGTVQGRREMSKVWDAIFPLVEPPPRGDGYGLILLNSNARSHFSLTNAIGVVNPSQLNALKSILRGSPSSAWMILLHHQVVEYPVASISLTDRIGLALVNAPDVLAAIAPHASRCLVLHGHRHRDWIGTCQDVVLCSAPSVTLGSQWEKCRGSFHVHEFAIGAGGSMRLTATERVKVS